MQHTKHKQRNKAFRRVSEREMCIICKTGQKKFQLECLGASTGVYTTTGMFARSNVRSSFKSVPHPSTKGSGRGVGLK